MSYIPFNFLMNLSELLGMFKILEILLYPFQLVLSNNNFSELK